MWPWVLDYLLNPELVRQFEWDAQKVSRHDGKDFTRVYTEPWTGDRWWEIQVRLNILLSYKVILILFSLPYLMTPRWFAWKSTQTSPCYLRLGWPRGTWLWHKS